MYQLEPDNDSTVFLDVIFGALIVIFAALVLLLPWINPEAEQSDRAPGHMVIEATWPHGEPIDVDLWAKAPGERPVGFNYKNTATLNLLRDDLGKVRDSTDINHEIIYARGLPKGEYVVNLHLFNHSGGPMPVPVTVTVSVRSSLSSSLNEVFTTTVELTHVKHELTVIRLTMDGTRVVRQSTIPMSLLRWSTAAGDI